MNTPENTPPENEKESSGFLSEEELQEIADELEEEPDYFCDMSIIGEAREIPDYSIMTPEEAEEAAEKFLEESWRRLSILYPGTVRSRPISNPKRKSLKSIPEWGRKLIEDSITNGELIQQVAKLLAEQKSTHEGRNIHITVNNPGSNQQGYIYPVPPQAVVPNPAPSPEVNSQMGADQLEKLKQQLQATLRSADLPEEVRDKISKTLQGVTNLESAFLGQESHAEPVADHVEKISWESNAEQLFQSEILRQAWKALQEFCGKSTTPPSARQVAYHLNELVPGLKLQMKSVSDIQSLVRALNSVSPQQFLNLKSTAEDMKSHYSFSPYDDFICPDDKLLVLNVLREIEVTPEIISHLAEMLELMCRKPHLLVKHFNEHIPAEHGFQIFEDQMTEKKIGSFIKALKSSSNLDKGLASSLRNCLKELNSLYVPWGYQPSRREFKKLGIPESIAILDEAKSQIISGLEQLISKLRVFGISEIPDNWEVPIFQTPTNLDYSNQLSDISMHLEHDGTHWKWNGMRIVDISTDSSTPSQVEVLVGLRLLHHNILTLSKLLDSTVETKKGRFNLYNVNTDTDPPVLRFPAEVVANDIDELCKIRNKYCIRIPAAQSISRVFHL